MSGFDMADISELNTRVHRFEIISPEKADIYRYENPPVIRTGLLRTGDEVLRQDIGYAHAAPLRHDLIPNGQLRRRLKAGDVLYRRSAAPQTWCTINNGDNICLKLEGERWEWSERYNPFFPWTKGDGVVTGNSKMGYRVAFTVLTPDLDEGAAPQIHFRTVTAKLVEVGNGVTLTQWGYAKSICPQKCLIEIRGYKGQGVHLDCDTQAKTCVSARLDMAKEP